MDHLLINRLFDDIFSKRYKREPLPWEATLGLAIVTGDLVVQRIPAAVELARVHHTAADVMLTLGIV